MIQPWLPAADAKAACPAAPAGDATPFSSGQSFGAMIEPLARMAPSAVIFHQGEENSGDPGDYACLFRAMIGSWRRTFSTASGSTSNSSSLLPFAFVQLQPCAIPPEMRYAQAQVAHSLSGVAMATAIDLGDAGNTTYHGQAYGENPNGMCHTRYKEEIADRLAAPIIAALKTTTTTTTTTAVARPAASSTNPWVSPPTVVSTGARLTRIDYRTQALELAVEGRVGPGGLRFGGTKQCRYCCAAPAAALEVLTTAGVWQNIYPGTDKHGTTGFNNATGTLQVMLVVEPPFQPLKVRYAWSDFPECVLYNEWQYPVAPFNVSLPQAS